MGKTQFQVLELLSDKDDGQAVNLGDKSVQKNTGIDLDKSLNKDPLLNTGLGQTFKAKGLGA